MKIDCIHIPYSETLFSFSFSDDSWISPKFHMHISDLTANFCTTFSFFFFMSHVLESKFILELSKNSHFFPSFFFLHFPSYFFPYLILSSFLSLDFFYPFPFFSFSKFPLSKKLSRISCHPFNLFFLHFNILSLIHAWVIFLLTLSLSLRSPLYDITHMQLEEGKNLLFKKLILKLEKGGGVE